MIHYVTADMISNAFSISYNQTNVFAYIALIAPQLAQSNKHPANYSSKQAVAVKTLIYVESYFTLT